MAQLKDLIVNGASRLIGDAFTNKITIETLADSAGSIGGNGQVLKSNGTNITWANLGAAASYNITNNGSPTKITTSTNLVTERSVYNGLPTINNSHVYTANTTIYAPTNVGTSGQFLRSDGDGEPNWETVTASTIGAAASGHTHGLSIAADSGTASITLAANTKYKLTAGGQTYVFQTPPDNNTTSFTITANATDGIWDVTGTNGTNAVTYAVGPYSSQQSKASFDTSTTNPTRSDRLNYNGYLYATKLYSGGSEVLTSHQSLSGYIPKSTLSGAYDIMYSSAANTPTRLAANTTATKKFLRMTGTGSAGAAPAWDTVSKSDVGLGNVDNTADANKTVKYANMLTGFASRSDSFSWGNQTGTAITVMNDSSGGSLGFRKDNPASGQMSMVIDGTVYIKEGAKNVGDAIVSITRNGTTFTYTTLWGTTGTFSQQDSNTWTQLSTSSAGYVGTKLPGNTTTFLRGDGTWNAPSYPVTKVAGKTGNVSLGTLKIGNVSYDGSASATVGIADLGLSTAITFLGVTSTDVSTTANSSTSTVAIVGGSNVTAANGNVVIVQSSGEEYVYVSSGSPKWQHLGLATSYALANHVHGNIANNGIISASATIASNDRLLIRDNSDTGKITTSSIVFDGSTKTKALTQAGTWETFNNYSHPTGSGNNHVPAGGSSGQFLAWSTTGTAKWVNNPNVNPTVTTTGSGNAVTAVSISGSAITVTKGATYNNYSHPSGDGNLHVPATGTSNNGKFLQAGSQAGSLSWAAAVTKVTAGTGLNTSADQADSATKGSITTTGTLYLTKSGVTAGSYGPSANVNGTNGTTMSVPYITVDAYGRVTSISNKTYTSVNTEGSDTKVTQNAAITTAGAYPVILAYSTATAAVTNAVNKAAAFTYNPSTQKLHAPIIEVTTASYGETLPSSGTAGQLFFQTSTGSMYELPTGGAANAVLVKNSASDRDVKWSTSVATATNASNATNAYTSASTAKAYIVGTTVNSASFKALVHNASVYTQNAVLFGAAWNDYAEFRKDNQEEEQEPGRCVSECGDGSLALTTKRLQRGCEIISDTFGFAIGQDEKNGYNTPVAISGRVLAYIYEGKEAAKSHIGWPVCSGPDGTVSIMTEEEEEKYPSRIIGIISEIPDYEYWGAKSVAVKERVWIRVK